ncbi:2-aminoadipate transaminase [compost metagenome]
MEAAVKLLKRYAPPGVIWNVPEGGLNLWLQLPDAEGIGKLHARAEQAGISFLPGDVCYSGEIPSRNIRLCYSQMKEADMKEGLRLFLELLTEHLKAGRQA